MIKYKNDASFFQIFFIIVFTIVKLDVGLVQRLISIADQRLYYGKQHGKNQVVSVSAGDE